MGNYHKPYYVHVPICWNLLRGTFNEGPWWFKEGVYKIIGSLAVLPDSLGDWNIVN